jgi:hypothetical protein
MDKGEGLAGICERGAGRRRGSPWHARRQERKGFARCQGLPLRLSCPGAAGDWHIGADFFGLSRLDWAGRGMPP